jgi:hypothetical protein
MRITSRVLIVVVVLGVCAFGLAGLMAPSVHADPQGQFCGGIAGVTCPEGYVCVDVPGDGCNPHHGGADCAGYCKKAH